MKHQRGRDDQEANDAAQAPKSVTDVVSLPLRPGGRPRRLPRWVRRLVAPLALLAGWQVFGNAGFIDPGTFAAPGTVLATGWNLVRTGELGTDLGVSLQRAGLGLLIGTLVGVVLALLAGLLFVGEEVIDAPMHMLRAVPIVGLTPLFIVWFGIDETPKVALIAVGTAFPIYLSVYAGVRHVDAQLVEAAQSVGLTRWGIIREVILPGALSSFFVGMRYAIVAALLLLVVSEQLNANSGIGYLMTSARLSARMDIVVLCLVIYAFLGLMSDVVLRLVERRALVWRRTFVGL
jgi:sulfonate transport system permease protein